MTACPWENHILHHNDFSKEDDKTLKSHSPESYVNMPLPTTTAPRTCKGSSMNAYVSNSIYKNASPETRCKKAL
jgi:hypothetical protein